MSCRFVSPFQRGLKVGVAVMAVIVSLISVAPCAGRGSDVVPPATPTAVRPHDQLWVVSCRGVVHQSSDNELSRLRYAAYRTNAGWSSATHAAFEAAVEPNSVTCVLVLGNGYTDSDTKAMGQKAYRRLVSSLPIDLPVRFVVWSWPSDHADTGPVKDLRIKAGRTWQVAHWLARWLDEVGRDRAVSLLGTSFGARIVMESLELRAAEIAKREKEVDPLPISQRAFNVVLVSAAVDNDWLLPGRQLDLAMSQVDRLLLVNNSSDWVLKRYHWLYGRRSKVSALGATGLPASAGLASATDKIAQYDAAPIVGRQHGCSAYFDSPRLVGLMRDCLFTREQDSAPLDSPPELHLPAPEGAVIPLASGTSGAKQVDGRQ